MTRLTHSERTVDGPPHGRCSTNKGLINADLWAFVQS